MSSPRGFRGLVPYEVLAVIAIALVPWPGTMPVALPLIVAGTISVWVRRRGWGERMTGGLDKVLVGAVAGVIAIVVAAPAYRMFGVTAVEWWLVPAARGDAARVAMAIVMVIAASAAMELALRAWIVERMMELSPGPATLPIVTGALAEAIVMPGPPAARIGAALFGIGLGTLYVAGGRSVVAPIAARSAFAIGAVLVEAMGVVG